MVVLVVGSESSQNWVRVVSGLGPIRLESEKYQGSELSWVRVVRLPCYIPNIKAVGLVVSEKKIFLVFPIVSLWDLSVAMETTILIQSAPKPNAINPPTQLWFTLNLIKISLLASEIFFFEIVDGRRTDDGRTDDDGRRMPAYPISSPVSLRLR